LQYFCYQNIASLRLGPGRSSSLLIKGFCKRKSKGLFTEPCRAGILIEEFITEEIPKASAGPHFLTYKLCKIFSFQAVSLASRQTDSRV
jgi:hypothetical protein